MGLLYDYHELLTLGFVKDTRGYVKKAEPNGPASNISLILLSYHFVQYRNYFIFSMLFTSTFHQSQPFQGHITVVSISSSCTYLF